MRTGSSDPRRGGIVCAGSAFPAGPASFRIHSVFPGTLNLRNLHDDRLYSVLNDPAFMHPNAVWAAEPGGGRLRFLDFTPGQPARLAPGVLEIGDRLSLTLEGAERMPVAEERAPFCEAADDEVVARCGAVLARYQTRKGSRLNWTDLAAAGGVLPGSRDGFHGRLIRGAFELGEAFRTGSGSAALGAAMELAGLGEGTTPAGDDFLCGFLLSAWSWSPFSLRKWSAGLLAEIGPPRARTTDISLLFLDLAARRLFSRALVRLARAFGPDRADEAAWEEAVAVLFRLGHSSGLDGAAGFLFGMRVGRELMFEDSHLPLRSCKEVVC